MLLLFALIVGSVNGVWADEEVVYTLETQKNGSNSAYASNFDVTINGLTWNAPGNQNIDGCWRIGGKSITEVERVITGKSSIDSEITKITFNHNGKSRASVSVPSVKLTVASDAKFNTVIDEVTISSPSITKGEAASFNFTPTSPLTKWNSGCYYKFTIVVSNSDKSNGGLDLTSIVFYKSVETVTKHTLSSAVSPVGVGTVTLGTTEVGEGKNTTIVAEATNPAYRFKNWTKTSGTIADENAASTTFTMGTTDATITANFEEIPSHTLSSVVTPTAAGTVTLSASSVKEGSTATAEAAANAGFKFTGWSITGSGASLSSTSDNPTTVTMGTEDATLTANFVAVTTYPVHWSVNGNILKTDNVEENTAISFEAPASGVPTGYAFRGWVMEANKIDTPSDIDPKANYVTSAVATAEITYYAVMAKETITPEYFIKYEKVTSAQTDWSGTYLLGATYSGGNTEENKGTWIYASPASSGKYGVKDAIGELTNEQEDNEIVIAKSANGYTIYHKNSSKYFGYGGSNNELNFYDAVSDKKQEWTITEVAVIKNVEYSSRVLQYNGSSPRFACYTTDQTATDLYKRIQGGGATYSGYCTTIPDESVTVTSAGLATYVSDFDLDYTGKSISAYIAKEEGGKIKMTQVYKVPAGTGVLLKADGGATVDIPVTTEATDDVTGNLFKRGNDAAVESGSGSGPYNYILNKIGGTVGFYRANNQKVAENRAYLQTTIDASANGRLSIFFDDEAGEATGIIEVKDVKAADAIFNLNGVRVKNMTKGLYIVNGKKMIVK